MGVSYHAIVLAGGGGERFGLVKQFIPLNGKPIFIHTLETLASDSACSIILVIPPEFKSIASNCLKHYKIQAKIVSGGVTRQQSVKNGLESIEGDSRELVLITDANRPLLTSTTFQQCIHLAENHENKAVLAAAKSINTSCTVDNGGFLNLDRILPREKMYELVMPQIFNLQLLKEAHSKTTLQDATDDMQVVLSVFPDAEAVLSLVSSWEGLKITHPDDYKLLEVLL